MITEAQMEEVITEQLSSFLESGKYDEFKQDYECSYNEAFNQALVWDEYVRTRSDLEIQDWFWDISEDGLSSDEIKNFKTKVTQATDIMCKLCEEANFPGLYANRRAV